jgi:hypothetical protein
MALKRTINAAMIAIVPSVFEFISYSLSRLIEGQLGKSNTYIEDIRQGEERS